ncbi:hypothetical protein [Niveibacterium sp.]|uniref:hypothetical protein n=1 Tax=Niveibacterium sp. TaxID=2017444 RepID=UPI0035B48F99
MIPLDIKDLKPQAFISESIRCWFHRGVPREPVRWNLGGCCAVLLSRDEGSPLGNTLLLAAASDGGGQYSLPTGTVLYFDRAYPEGFSRFRVYINVDRMPLRLKSLDDTTLIDPLDAVAPNQNDIERT